MGKELTAGIDEELELKTLNRMVDAGLADADELEVEVEETAEPAAEEKEPVETTPVEEVPAASEEKPTSPTPDADDDKGIPDAYYRAALHQKWTPDEIKGLYEQNPDLAVKTFKKLYDDTNKLTSEFAQLGRAKLKQKPEEAPPAATGELDLKELKDQYGEDSAIVKTVAALMQRQQPVQPVQPTQPPVQAGSDAGTRKLIDNFFGADQMKLYDDFYGKGIDPMKLTQEQLQRRRRVLQTADEIMVGAEALGRTIVEEEALEAAHLQISEPVREQVIRKGILASVQKRSKGLTLQPGSRQQVKPEGGRVTEPELVGKTEDRLAKLKW